MFQLFITITTITATGLHALFGCCWHHDHAKQHVVCHEKQPTSEVEIGSEHQCDCHHACSPGSDTESQKDRQFSIVAIGESCPCDHQHNQDSAPCDEGHCQYVVNAKVELPSLNGPSVISPLNLAICDMGSQVFDYAGLPLAHRSASLLSGSLCVRDVTQIALI